MMPRYFRHRPPPIKKPRGANARTAGLPVGSDSTKDPFVELREAVPDRAV